VARPLASSSQVCSHCIEVANEDEAVIEIQCISTFGIHAPAQSTFGVYAPAQSTIEGSGTELFDRSRRCPGGHCQGAIRLSHVGKKSGLLDPGE
jgi:hypothetical protein